MIMSQKQQTLWGNSEMLLSLQHNKELLIIILMSPPVKKASDGWKLTKSYKIQSQLQKNFM